MNNKLKLRAMKNKFNMKTQFNKVSRFAMIPSFLLFVSLITNSLTVSAQTSLNESEVVKTLTTVDTTMKCWPIADAKLLVEYAEKGFDYDSTVASHDREVIYKDSIILAQNIQMDACENATEHLGGIVSDLQKDALKANKKIRNLKGLAFGTSISTIFFTLLFLLK